MNEAATSQNELRARHKRDKEECEAPFLEPFERLGFPRDTHLQHIVLKENKTEKLSLKKKQLTRLGQYANNQICCCFSGVCGTRSVSEVARET